MTLREKFEASLLSRGVGKAFLERSKYGDYINSDIADVWRGYQAGHAEGIKEAARRCAEIADKAIDAEIAQWRITKEYPEAFK